MQLTKLIAACFLGLLSFSVAAPSNHHSKPDLDFYAKILLPMQIQRLMDFNSIWAPILKPEQKKFLDNLSNKLHHMDFKDFDKLKEEGNKLFPSNTENKVPRYSAISPIFDQLKDIAIHYQ